MSDEPIQLRSPTIARKSCDRLLHQRDTLRCERDARILQRQKVRDYLDVADDVSAALEKLGEQLFGDVIAVIEQQLSLALQEVLEQPLKLKVERKFERGGAALDFYVERQ